MDELFRVEREEATMCVLDFSDHPDFPIGITVAQRGALIGNGIALTREEALGLAAKLESAAGGFQCERCPLADPGDCMHHGHCRHRDGPKPNWRCFFCDEVFNDRSAAALHFGASEDQIPGCRIKGSEGGLLKVLRETENALYNATEALHAESADALLAWRGSLSRHNAALRLAEEAGYQRGLDDARTDHTLGGAQP